MVKCPRCDRDVLDGLSECPHCGVIFSKLQRPGVARETKQRPATSAEPTAKRSSTPMVSKGFLVALLLLAGAGAWFYYYGPCGTRRCRWL